MNDVARTSLYKCTKGVDLSRMRIETLKLSLAGALRLANKITRLNDSFIRASLSEVARDSKLDAPIINLAVAS
jgi:hypothetical protein